MFNISETATNRLMLIGLAAAGVAVGFGAKKMISHQLSDEDFDILVTKRNAWKEKKAAKESNANSGNARDKKAAPAHS